MAKENSPNTDRKEESPTLIDRWKGYEAKRKDLYI